MIAGVGGGVLLASWLGPQYLSRFAWYNSNQAAALAATAALGYVGYRLLRKYNRAAALAVLGGAVGFPLAGFIAPHLPALPGAFVGPGTKGLGDLSNVDDGDTLNGMRGRGLGAGAFTRPEDITGFN